MSIQSEITLLQNTKKNLKSAIMEKGVTVYPSDLFSTYPTRISQITSTPGDKDSLFRSLIERTATSIDIPNGTEVLRYGAFYHYTTLTSVTIPDTVSYIGNRAFFECSGLTSITIPSSVSTIGKTAFTDSNNLTSITCLSETPPAFEDGNYETSNNLCAFDGTNNCPIYVPAASVQAFKTAWSRYASRIQKMPEPVVTKQIFVRVQSTNDVTTGKYIFMSSDADALNASLIKQTTSTVNGINAANNVISLNDSFCHYGSGVAIVPRSEFADAATFDYDALAQKTYWVDKSDNDTKHYLTPYGGSLFDYGNTTTVPSTNITVGTATASQDSSTFVTFMTPNSTYLGYNNASRFGWFISSAFMYRSYLLKLVDVAAVKTADVTLTDSTTDEIFEYYNTAAPMISGVDTSYYNKQIASVRINDNVTELGGSAFYKNTYLTSVNIPDSVTSIGQYAFEDCTALATVTIGTGIQSIADEAFGGYEYNTSNLTSVTVKATTPPTLGSFVFNYSMSGEIINPNLVIYVPSASVDAYKSAWSEYADRIQAIPS